jgi:hypothetical protein
MKPQNKQAHKAQTPPKKKQAKNKNKTDTRRKDKVVVQG